MDGHGSVVELLADAAEGVGTAPATLGGISGSETDESVRLVRSIS